MTEVQEPASFVEAAEQAAAAGDYPTAADRLRDAADWQERHLGPDHPDLVNTLNNLGVALERSGRFDEAEAAYRCAYAIARKVYAADHPFVATSAANLREFCDAHGAAFDPPAPTPAPTPPPQPKPVSVAAPPPVPVPAPAPAPAPARASASAPQPAAPRAFPPKMDELRPRSLRIPITLGAVVIVVGLIAWLVTGSPDETGSPAVTPAAGAERGEAAPPPVSPARQPPATSSPRETPAATPRGAGSAAALTVLRAEVCQALVTRAGAAEWTCTPAGASVPPGRLAYYSRIRSASAVNVEHRWYRGNSLQQRVELPVQANPSAGYRTYSRRTIGADEAGEWRVELRSASGALLHEQRFVVR